MLATYPNFRSALETYDTSSQYRTGPREMTYNPGRKRGLWHCEKPQIQVLGFLKLSMSWETSVW